MTPEEKMHIVKAMAYLSDRIGYSIADFHTIPWEKMGPMLDRALVETRPNFEQMQIEAHIEMLKKCLEDLKGHEDQQDKLGVTLARVWMSEGFTLTLEPGGRFRPYGQVLWKARLEGVDFESALQRDRFREVTPEDAGYRSILGDVFEDSDDISAEGEGDTPGEALRRAIEMALEDLGAPVEGAPVTGEVDMNDIPF